MGRYINLPEATATEKQLSLAARGAKKIENIPSWNEIPGEKTLICVGDRGIFQYAAVIYDEMEYKEFTSQNDHPQYWFLIESSKIDGLLSA